VSTGGTLSDVKVGAFVLAALATLIFGSLWIAGSSFFGAPRLSYKVLLMDSRGVQDGDRVRVAGVSVGRIRGVNLQPGAEWPVTLTVAIRPSIRLREDASAKVQTSGLLGSSFLELVPGSTDAAPLPEGSEIRGTPSGGLEDAMERVGEITEKAVGVMDQVSEILETISSNLGPLLARLDLLISEENADNVRELLASLRATSEDVGPRVSTLLGRLDVAAGRLETGLEGLPEISADLRTLVAGVRTAMGRDGERLTRVLEAAEGSLTQAEETLAVIGGNRAEIDATLRDLRDTVANLKAFSQQIKERPYSLVRIKAPPERQPGDGVEDKDR